MRQTDYH